MKIVQINSVCGVGSTGKICTDISRLLTENNIENYILCSYKTGGYEFAVPCTERSYIRRQVALAHIRGNYGFNSVRSTRRMIAELERIKPDIVHLHNIHSHECNLKLLFDYFREKKTKLVWTFHDCWAFSAYCTHFVMAGCDKWKTGCKKCPQQKDYSLFFDRSKTLFKRKKQLFTGLDMTIVTPSQWLADLVKESFMGEYPVKVINNGIDLSVFAPCESDFRKKHQISADTKLLLGVAFDWGIKKGLDVFINLANQLDLDKYKVVLVGTNDSIDQTLPDNIISIHKTNDQRELAEIYSACDLLINPTREDTYPTVNMESIACRTPVITFDTGGSPEIIDEKTGVVVAKDDFASLKEAICQLCDHPLSPEDCTKKAQTFDKNLKYEEYLGLYRSL